MKEPGSAAARAQAGYNSRRARQGRGATGWVGVRQGEARQACALQQSACRIMQEGGWGCGSYSAEGGRNGPRMGRVPWDGARSSKGRLGWGLGEGAWARGAGEASGRPRGRPRVNLWAGTPSCGRTQEGPQREGVPRGAGGRAGGQAPCRHEGNARAHGGTPALSSRMAAASLNSGGAHLLPHLLKRLLNLAVHLQQGEGFWGGGQGWAGLAAGRRDARKKKQMKTGAWAAGEPAAAAGIRNSHCRC